MIPSYKGNKLKEESGTIECKIDTLHDFFEILKENNNFQGFIFRGQQFKSHDLEPTILRAYKNDRYNLEEYQRHVEDHYINFITSLRGRFNEQFDAEKDKYEIWALGQHFGLCTPLLDWTASPWVALYFAFRENRFERIFSKDSKESINKKINRLSEERSVYFLNAKAVINGYHFQIRSYFLQCYENNTISYPSKTSGEYDIRFIESVKSKSSDGARKIIDVFDGFGEDIVGISDYTKKCCEYSVRKVGSYFPKIVSPKKGFNNRLVSQRGLFTYSPPTPNSLEKDLMMIWMNMEHKDNFILLKLLVPDNLRDEILETLYEMNINDLSLFPDIHGACSYANWKINR